MMAAPYADFLPRLAGPPCPTPLSDPDWPFCKIEADGSVILTVHVVPQAAQTRAEGLHAQALRVRLNAPPVDGKANAALVDWLATQLQIPRRHIALLHGASSRRKLLRIDSQSAEVARWSALWPQGRFGAV